MVASVIEIHWGGQSTGHVSPREGHGIRGGLLTWFAVDSDVSLWFPNPQVFGVTELHIPRGTERSLVMQAGTPDGRYPYAVFCHAGNCFAKGDGGTEPVIIIP